MRGAAIILATILPASTMAQTSFPMITHTNPVAVQRGQTAEITVEGQMNFAGAYQMLIQGDRIKAEIVAEAKPTGKQNTVRLVKLKLTVAQDAALGVREFRLASTLGISSLGQLLVVDEPVVTETNPNNTIAQANAVLIPSVVCGKIEAAEDVDCYKFSARAGQTLTFEVFSARLQDKIHDLQKHIDPLISLLDADGRELAASDDFNFADPLLTYKIPKDGNYVLQIRDAKYDGDPRWVYAVRITDRPFISHLFPMAGNPGKVVEVEPVGSARLAQPKIQLKAPDKPGLHEMQLVAAGRSTNPVPFYVTELPCITETEPNDTIAAANRVTVPCAINGRIGTRRDMDHFIFKAAKGKALKLEVKARRFNTEFRSSLDSFLEVLSPTGAVLASNDDETGKDAGLVFTPQADGDVIVRLRDLNSKGGDTAVYCLEISEAKPDFTLRVDPGKAMIGPGSSIPWYVLVTRTNGFAGPIDVTIDGLPAGVTCTALTIPPTMTQGLMVLTAAPGAKVAATPVRVIGKAKIGDATIERIAALSEEVYLPGGGRGRIDAVMPAVAVTEPSDILRVDVTPKEISLKPGEEVKLDVTITRRPDYDKSVSLDVMLRHLGSIYGNPLPPGVTIDDNKSKTLIGTGNQGHIILKAAANAAPIDNVPISVLAHVSINFVVKISYSSPVIPLSVRK